MAVTAPSGGTITTDGLYTVHKFTSNGTFIVPYVKAGRKLTALICGAGGQWYQREWGGSITSSGGGGGDMVEISDYVFSSTSYSIIVGGVSGSQGGNGGSSSAFGYTAIGGGGGAGDNENGKNGGSGGAADRGYSGGIKTGNGYGYAGGVGGWQDGLVRDSGGGGGGAGGVGGNGLVNGGNGGLPRYNSITGSSRPYCAGGAGGKSWNTGGVDGTTSDSDYGRGGYGYTTGGGWIGNAQPGVVIIRFLTSDCQQPIYGGII